MATLLPAKCSIYNAQTDFFEDIRTGQIVPHDERGYVRFSEWWRGKVARTEGGDRELRVAEALMMALRKGVLL